MFDNFSVLTLILDKTNTYPDVVLKIILDYCQEDDIRYAFCRKYIGFHSPPLHVNTIKYPVVFPGVFFKARFGKKVHLRPNCGSNKLISKVWIDHNQPLTHICKKCLKSM